MAYWCDGCGRQVLALTEYTGDPPFCGKCGEMAREGKDEEEA